MTERDRGYAMLGMATAWRRFETRALEGRGAEREFERCIRQMESASEQLNLARESIHLAAEIAAFEPALDEDDRLADVDALIGAQLAEAPRSLADIPALTGR